MNKPIELVVFDLGGVLVRICRSWNEVFRRAGLPEDPALLAESALTQITHINNRWETGEIDEPSLLHAITALSRSCTHEHVAHLLDAWLIEPYPGIEQLIADVALAGCASACLSNTNPRHWRTMMHADVRFHPLRSLRYPVASFQINTMKPDARAYQAVELASGARPESIIFFDDNAANIHGALERGWRAHLIDHAGDTAHQMRTALRDLRVL